MTDAPTAPAPLLLTSRQTAAALQVCEKTLWALTRNGRLPVVRIGRAVRYDVADVQRFIEAAKTGGRP
jgi:excisionase family DNA binding protein